MDRKKVWRIVLGAFLAVMALLTVLFFLGIKFVVGINIIVWDVLTAAVWIFVKLCRWAGREHTGRRSWGVASITLLGLFAAAMMFTGLCIYGALPSYIEQTEPQTRRTFVAEYTSNMMGRGRVKLYERFGPVLLACAVEEYVGDISPERPEGQQIYISGDEKSIVVAYFFLWPIFFVPLE